MPSIRTLTLVVFLFSLTTGCTSARQNTTPPPGAAVEDGAGTMAETVRYLSSDGLQGRESGTPGGDAAATWIEERLQTLGLSPLFGTTYRQSFDVTTGIEVGEGSAVTVTVKKPQGQAEWTPDPGDWAPAAYSGSGDVRGDVVSAGYGLSDGDFAPLAHGPAGRIAFIDGGVPPDSEAHGGIDSSQRRRAVRARDAGAAAVVVMLDEVMDPSAGEAVPGIGIPVVQVGRTAAAREALEAAGSQVHVTVSVAPITKPAYNVGAAVRSTSSDEWIVVGAHYDHLGMGGAGSLAPDAVEPHNGADDNASGTAVVLELARRFADSDPGRNLAFVLFGAEEMGLLGSDHFAAQPPFGLDGVQAMINYDMVGRLREGRLQVFGTETADEFDALLDELEAAYPLSLSRVGDGYGPSDHTSFYARGVPVLHLFSGTHSEYHRPEDDWELVNFAGMAHIADFSEGLIQRLAAREDRLTYVAQERPQPSGGGGGGYGPYLGTVPDFGEVEGGGLRLTAVRAGSPAEQAGLKGGDVVVRFGDKAVGDIYDYTYALRERKPGDVVEIEVRRDGATLVVQATLGRRSD